MARLASSPPPAPVPGSQQQAAIDAVARRQYGRWAVRYREANVWAAVERDAALRAKRNASAGSAPPPDPIEPAGRSVAQRLPALVCLRDSGARSDAEFARLKAAVLSAP